MKILILIILIWSLFVISEAQFENDECRLPHSGKKGICRNYRDCPKVVELYRRGYQYKICSFSSGFPIVCCPTEPRYSGSFSTLQSTTSTPKKIYGQASHISTYKQSTNNINKQAHNINVQPQQRLDVDLQAEGSQMQPTVVRWREIEERPVYSNDETIIEPYSTDFYRQSNVARPPSNNQNFQTMAESNFQAPVNHHRYQVKAQQQYSEPEVYQMPSQEHQVYQIPRWNSHQQVSSSRVQPSNSRNSQNSQIQTPLIGPQQTEISRNLPANYYSTSVKFTQNQSQQHYLTQQLQDSQIQTPQIYDSSSVSQNQNTFNRPHRIPTKDPNMRYQQETTTSKPQQQNNFYKFQYYPQDVSTSPRPVQEESDDLDTQESISSSSHHLILNSLGYQQPRRYYRPQTVKPDTLMQPSVNYETEKQSNVETQNIEFQNSRTQRKIFLPQTQINDVYPQQQPYSATLHLSQVLVANQRQQSENLRLPQQSLWKDQTIIQPSNISQNQSETNLRQQAINNIFPSQQANHERWNQQQSRSADVSSETSSDFGLRISARKCNEFKSKVTKKTIVGGLIANPRALQISEETCDWASGLIVGGSKTNKGEFPHMAALGYYDKSNEPQFFCGGTLISEKFVLTAGHCKTHTNENPFARLGDHNIKSRFDGVAELDIPIAEFIRHEEYSRLTKQNDIALVRLTRSVTFTKSIRPACLWQPSEISQRSVVATGWGSTEYVEANSDELLKVRVSVLDTSTCAEAFDDLTINDNQICAGVMSGGRDTCHGDSGGPIQVILPDNKCIYHVVGITSFGASCGARKSPSVYTRVSSYLDWIEPIVWG